MGHTFLQTAHWVELSADEDNCRLEVTHRVNAHERIVVQKSSKKFVLFFGCSAQGMDGEIFSAHVVSDFTV